MWRGETYQFITPNSKFYFDNNEIIRLEFYTIYLINVIVNITNCIYIHPYTHNSIFNKTNCSLPTVWNIERVFSN